MRLDRLVSVSAVRAVRTLSHRTGARFLPVLMYHSVSDLGDAGRSSYYKVCTSPARFAEQMQWLNELGCRGVTLSAGLALLATGHASPVQPVAITFDDGFQDFHTTAWPILQHLGYSATMYVPTGFIGHTRQHFAHRPCLTWSEVRELAAAGVEFGSHTVNHATLFHCSWTDIAREVADSKARLQDELGASVSGFAYPYAFPQADAAFTSRLTEMLSSEGYRHCATTVIGRFQPGDDLFRVKRLPANDDDDRLLFRAKLRGDYDWLGYLQAASKAARHRLRLVLGRSCRDRSASSPRTSPNTPRPVVDRIAR